MSGIFSVSFCLGVLAGFMAGVTFQKGRGAWQAYFRTRQMLPAMRRTALSSTRTALGWGLVLIAASFILISWMRSGEL